MIENKKLKIFEIIFIVFSIMAFLGVHLLQALQRYITHAYFFGFIIHMNFFVDVILLIGFIFLFIVIVQILISI